MMAVPARKLSRLGQALAIRDHVLSFLHEAGNMTEVGGTRFLTWDGGPWRFSLRMDRLPSLRIPENHPNAYHAAVKLHDVQEERGGLNLDYALDIWRGPKVFLAEWNADTPSLLDIASFKRGTWEIALFAFKPQDRT